MSRFLIPFLCLFFVTLPVATANPSTLEFSKSGVTQNQAGEAQHDLTGYWKYGDDRVLYLTQKGSNVRSRYIQQTPDYAHFAEEIDFSANIVGNLLHGVQLIRLPWPMHNKCPVDMHVGIGLTMNESRTSLTGFRASRTVNLINCTVESGEPVQIEYTRMLDIDGKPKK